MSRLRFFGGYRTATRTGWTRAAVPLLSASVSWEGQSVQEPCVLYESGTWKMWYTGASGSQGLGGPCIGYATCTSDPTVTGNWTKYASNPVIGHGTVVSTDAAGGQVTKVGSTYYLYYRDDTSTQGGNLKVTTSSDGISWGTPSTALASGGTDGYGNSFVWNEGGSTWKMIAEQYSSGITNWLLKYATSTDGLSWSVVQTLTGVPPPGYAGTSGPNLMNGGAKDANGYYNMWFHVSQVNNSQLWFARSTDAKAWTYAGGAELYNSGSTYEREQIADPCMIDAADWGGSVSYLFYDGVSNSKSPAPPANGYINIASYPGPGKEIVRYLA